MTICHVAWNFIVFTRCVIPIFARLIISLQFQRLLCTMRTTDDIKCGCCYLMLYFLYCGEI